jgi:hypothetical protein
VLFSAQDLESASFGEPRKAYYAKAAVLLYDEGQLMDKMASIVDSNAIGSVTRVLRRSFQENLIYPTLKICLERRQSPD